MLSMAVPRLSGSDLFFGGFLSAALATPIQAFMAKSRELGSIFSIGLPDNDIVIVSDAHIVAELCDESKFMKHTGGLLYELLREYVGDGLITAHNNEPNWAAAHEILTPAFSQAAMRRYHSTMVDTANRLSDGWQRLLGGPPVDMTDEMTRLTLEIIGLVGFGHSFGSFGDTERHPFVSALNVLTVVEKQAVNGPFGASLGNYAPNTKKESADYIKSVVADVISERRKSDPKRTDDLLGRMLNSPTEANGKYLDDENICNQILTFLVGGHESTGGALTFALYYLTSHTDVLRRVRAEVDQVIPPSSRHEPTYDQVLKFRYLRRVINESLRLWPTGTAFTREARADTTLAAGKYPIKKGEWVLVLTPMLHRQSIWGNDVESFDPDRFLPAQIKQRPAHSYLPFGTGHRSCIGRQFALYEMTLMLAMFIQRFDFEPDPAYKLEVRETLTFLPSGFRLKLLPRASA